MLFRSLLGMAMRELPLPATPDWGDPRHVAAFRAVYLAVVTDYRDRLWRRVADRVRRSALGLWVWKTAELAMLGLAANPAAGGGSRADCWKQALCFDQLDERRYSRLSSSAFLALNSASVKIP